MAFCIFLSSSWSGLLIVFIEIPKQHEQITSVEKFRNNLLEYKLQVTQSTAYMPCPNGSPLGFKNSVCFNKRLQVFVKVVAAFQHAAGHLISNGKIVI